MSLNLGHTVISAPTVKESNMTAVCRNVSFWINSPIRVDVSFLFGRAGREEGRGKRMVFLFYNHRHLGTFSKQHDFLNLVHSFHACFLICFRAEQL